MKTLTNLIVLVIGLGMSLQASADRHGHYRYGYTGQPIELAMKARVNGDRQIRLRRLIESHHRIDTRNYLLRSVTIGNKARYPAAASLRVGRYATGFHGLHRGVTHINAPRSRARGPWILDIDQARVRWISVVLEPIGDHRRPRHRYRRYAHGWW